MATITIRDIRNSPLALMLVQIDAQNAVEIYIPKQMADLVTQANTTNTFTRANADRVITGV